MGNHFCTGSFSIYNIYFVFICTAPDNVTGNQFKRRAITPIYISRLGGIAANVAAPRALKSEPTSETETMIKELGALIMDIQTLGRLTLTNKRILYHASGKSIKGQSMLLNEMPLEDTSGMSASIITSINWITMTLFSLVLFGILFIIQFALPVSLDIGSLD